jgi:uncharacterized lipoprotein YddW (UPF0748 family)
MIKAVWLTNVDSQILNSRQNIAAGLNQLHQLGFNTIYPVVWQRGYTLYPSTVAESWTGATVMPDSPFTGRDLLAEIIELAAPYNMRVIPWFEYGLMLPPRSNIASQFPELISIDSRGQQQRMITASGKQDPQVWLNPCVPQVQEFLVDLIADVVQRYPVAGIQLDDRFGFPQELGYDGFTQQLFKQQQAKIAPHNHADPAWIDWGCHLMTALLDRIVRAVKSVRANCLVSISPNPLGFSRRNYLADWQAWHQSGLIDELVLQVYRDNLLAFSGELNRPEVVKIRDQIPTSIGILTGLKTKPIVAEMIKQQTAMTLAKGTFPTGGFAGVAYFFYETVIHQQLTPTVVARTPSALTDIFG